MSTWHFALALAIGVYGYVLLPDWFGMLAATSMYILWQEGFEWTLLTT